jgi:hypothetical protein
VSPPLREPSSPRSVPARRCGFRLGHFAMQYATVDAKSRHRDLHNIVCDRALESRGGKHAKETLGAYRPNDGGTPVRHAFNERD